MLTLYEIEKFLERTSPHLQEIVLELRNIFCFCRFRCDRGYSLGRVELLP